MLDVAAPRFVTARAPHYESFYVRVWDPAIPRAAWIRYTTFLARGRGTRGSLWVTAYEPDGVVAFRQDELTAGAGPGERWATIGDASIWEDPDRSLHLAGRAAADGHSGRWTIAMHPRSDPWLHLAPSWLYAAPIPRTKSTSPVVFAPAAATLEIDGTTRTYTSAMLGHNWGTEHAYRWIWIHGANGAGDAIDLVGGRLKVAGRVLPWKLSGLLATDGTRRRIGGMLARARVDASAQRCSFAVAGLEGEAVAGPHARWSYDDPSGGVHDVTNSSIATVRVRAGGRDLAFTAAAYEFGSEPETVAARPGRPAGAG